MQITKIIELRVLLYFWHGRGESATVTNMACTLGTEKYTITRTLKALEKKELVNFQNSRRPFLTEQGKYVAEYYAKRMDYAMNHLMYEGVDLESAKRDAQYWALYNSEKTMEVIRATEERYRIKYELRNRGEFSGELLCKKMKDGVYQFPFLVYREVARGGNNISMVNEGFEHPCTLSIRNGVGIILLRTRPMVRRKEGKEVQVRIRGISYMSDEQFIGAEVNGAVMAFPAAALRFVNIGQGVGQILHGSVRLRMENTGKSEETPDLTAIFTIMI